MENAVAVLAERGMVMDQREKKKKKPGKKRKRKIPDYNRRIFLLQTRLIEAREEIDGLIRDLSEAYE